MPVLAEDVIYSGSSHKLPNYTDNLASLNHSCVQNYSKVCCAVLSHSVMFGPFVACQAPLSMGILQAKILEWVAMPSCRGSSQPRDRTQASCIAGRFFTSWATREAPLKGLTLSKLTRRLNLGQETQYIKMNYMNVVFRARRNFGDNMNETIQPSCRWQNWSSDTYDFQRYYYYYGHGVIIM